MTSTPPPGPPQPPGPPRGYGPSSAAGPPPIMQPAPAGAPSPAGAPYAAGRAQPQILVRRSGSLLLAQVVAILEGIVMLLLGIGIILLGVFGREHFNTFIAQNPGLIPNSVNANTLTNYVTGAFIGVGAFVVIYFAIFIWAAVRAGRPSVGARLVVVILDVLFVLFSLLSFRNSGTSTTLSVGNRFLIGYIVFWALQAIILFGMLVHGTRRVAVATGPPR